MKKCLFLSTILLACLTLNPVLSSAADNPKEFKLGFITSLSGTFAAVAETQKKGVLLAVDQINARGGLTMPWGKVKVEVITKDDEAKLDVGVRRFREHRGPRGNPPWRVRNSVRSFFWILRLYRHPGCGEQIHRPVGIFCRGAHPDCLV